MAASMKENAQKSSKMKEEEQRIRKRVACEERAFRIVERLIEGSTTEDALSNAAQFLTPDHYADIVEERAIEKICGYPICSKFLGPIPKQKYKISTKTNKVYDLTDRKNYCSNWCYKASKYLQKQIPSVPVWAREGIPPVNFSFIGKYAQDIHSGGYGEEVLDNSELESLRKDVEQLKKPEKNSLNKSRKDVHVEQVEVSMDKLKIKEPSMEKNTGIDTKFPKSIVVDEKIDESSIPDFEITKVSADSKESCHALESIKLPTVPTEHVSIVPKTKSAYTECSSLSSVKVHEAEDDSDDCDNADDSSDHIKCEEESNEKVDQLMELLDKKKNILSNMVQCETVVNVSTKVEGESTQRTEKEMHRCSTKWEQLPEISSQTSVLEIICNRVSEWMNEGSLHYLRSTEHGEHAERTGFERKYEKMCKEFDTKAFKFSKLMAGDTNESSKFVRKTLPDVEELEKLKDYDIKVKEFFKGSYTYKVKDEDNNVADDDTSTEIHFPIVDSHDQLLIRQKIVLDKLNKVMPEMLPHLKLSIQDVFTELRELVSTFTLTSENILFKHSEWTLIALFLLKLLAWRIPKVEEAFKLDPAIKFFSILLSALKMTLDDVDQFTLKLYQLPLRTKSSNLQDLD
ncbi:hypothetical protein ScPMuIL_011155 [Solemya velum]